MSEFKPYTIGFVDEVLDTIYKNAGSEKYLLDYPVCLPRIPRVSFGLAPRENVYIGKIYTQGEDETCLTWAFVNCLAALGLRPQSSLVVDLLNSRDRGFTLQTFDEVLKRYPFRGFKVIDVVDDKNEEFGLLPLNLASNLIEETERGDPIIARKTRSAVIKRNGLLFKYRIDSGQVYFLAVDYLAYEGSKGADHMVAGVGYRVTPKGYMDVQLLDSNKGSVWLELEHFSQAITPDSLFVRKRGGRVRPTIPQTLTVRSMLMEIYSDL